MNKTISRENTAVPCLPRGSGTLIGIVTAIGSGGLLLRYLHLEGIEPAFLDILTTPTVALPILALFMGQLFLLAFMFTVPIWLIGLTLVEKAQPRTVNQTVRQTCLFPGFCTRWSPETLCALGLLAWCRRRKSSADSQPEHTTPIPSTLSEPVPLRQHSISLLIIGAVWAVQLLVFYREDTLSTGGVLALLLLTPLLAGLGLARWQGRSFRWSLYLFFILEFGCVQIVVFSLLIQKTAAEDNVVLSAALSILIYLVVLMSYLSTHEAYDKAKAGESPDTTGLYQAAPAWIWRRLPLLASILYLAVFLLFLAESRLLGEAANLVGIKGSGRHVQVQSPPTTDRHETEKNRVREESPADGAPHGWRTFDTSYHFGAIEILCLKDNNQAGNQNCHVARDGVIRFAFPKIQNKPANTTTVTGSPHE